MTSTVRDLLKDDDKRTVSRTAFGVGVGAGLGFVLGGPAGAGIGALAGGTLGAISDPGPQKGELTEARERFFWRAMASENAEAVAKAATIMREAELYDHADALERHAKLLTLPEGERASREATMLRALCSSKIAGVERIAEFFREQGAMVAAAALVQHAHDLRALEAGKVDQSTIDRLERIVSLVRERVDAERLASAEANVQRARDATAAPPPEPAPSAP